MNQPADTTNLTRQRLADPSTGDASRTGSHKIRRRRTPVDAEKSILWNLDDTRPAGPYPADLDESGLRLICLATIRQAVMDVHSSKNPTVITRARQFLTGAAKDWLKAMKISRRGGADRVYDLIYRGDYEQLSLLLEEQL